MKPKIIIIIFLILIFIIFIIRINYKLFLTKEEKEIFYKGIKDTHELFKENNIPYFIICGTLLGSIRHSDIIPWDDDIDIGILDKDINKVNNLNYSRYGYTFINCGKNGCGKIILNKNLYIDIFPFERIQDNNEIKYQYIEDNARKLWPNDYFYEKELFPIRNNYKFGELYLLGPNNCDNYKVRAWGKNWNKPKLKNSLLNLIYPEILFN